MSYHFKVECDKENVLLSPKSITKLKKQSYLVSQWRTKVQWNRKNEQRTDVINRKQIARWWI